MNFQGAIFDMDGTFLDSMPKWYTIGADFLRAQGREPAADFQQIILPMTLSQSAEHMIKTYNLSGMDILDVVEAINTMLAEYYRTEAPLKEHAPEFLFYLKEQGIKMCVATATDRPLVEAALQRLGILDLFEFIITVREAGASKHQPDIFIQALERLGIPKDQTLIFEDALHAIRTATAAGFRVIGLYDAASEHHQAEIKTLCERYLTNFSEWEDN